MSSTEMINTKVSSNPTIEMYVEKSWLSFLEKVAPVLRNMGCYDANTIETAIIKTNGVPVIGKLCIEEGTFTIDKKESVNLLTNYVSYLSNVDKYKIKLLIAYIEQMPYISISMEYYCFIMLNSNTNKFHLVSEVGIAYPFKDFDYMLQSVIDDFPNHSIRGFHPNKIKKLKSQ